MTDRIKWEEGKYSSHYGTVNGFRLFTLSWGTKRDDPKPWKLRTDLPVRIMDDSSETVEGGKQRAERILRVFVHKLGASFDD